MNNVNDAVIFGIRGSKDMVDALTADLKADDWEHRAVPGANCAAWIVGHLILTDRMALNRAGITKLAALPDGFETRFGRQLGAPEAEHFGDVSVLMPLFDLHRERLLEAVAAFPTANFNDPLPIPHPRFKTFGEFFLFMGFHVMMHAGQISTIRRSLGRPALF